MKLKLINTKGTVEKNYKDFLNDVKPNSFFYFHNDTSYKDLKNLIDKLQNDGYTIYFREVKTGLDKNNYIYELHIL
ncbi:MAG: hypothetical protein GWP10_19125 [Nitrospiraceae bacterium]|nr:hypothetical protein [Nitrospiraceae bacterium]